MIKVTKPIVAAIIVDLAIVFAHGMAVVPPATWAAQGVRLTLGPYLQALTPELAIACWGTDGAVAGGAVVYGTTSEYGSKARAEQVGTVQCARLVDLKSYTRYHYRVLQGDAALSANATFRTLAGPDQESLSLVAWGDNRTNYTIHRQLAGKVKETAPDLVINVGDFVESGERMSDWRIFFDAERELLANAPFYPVLGNHEQNSPLYFSLLSLPGNKRWYSFDSGPVHFVALDVVFSGYRLGSEQYTWLEQDLKETSRPWKIVYFHFPPYSFSAYRPGIEAVRRTLPPLFERYGVQLVLSGHDHYYQRNQVNGLTYIVTGGGGAPLHPVARSAVTLFTEETYHFLKISVNKDVLTSTGVRLNGSEFDPFSLVLVKAGTERQEPPATPRSGSPVSPEPAAISPSAEISLIEGLSCLRCHRPFRLTNGQLLAYAWDYHRSAAVAGGVVLASFMLALGLRYARARS